MKSNYLSAIQFRLNLVGIALVTCFLAGAQTVTPWITTGDQSKLLQQQATVSFSTNSGTNASTITLNAGTSYQSIDGFGFCLTEGSAEVISGLAATQQDALLNELFNQSSGIGVSVIRISIGASDLSSSNYSYNEVAGDVNMNNFSLAGPDLTYLIPILKKALTINPNIKILATPWSAPTWMKTNNSWIGGNLRTEYYEAYANYFVKYFAAMQAQGINIWAITPQNEPLNPYNNPSMYMSSTEQKDFINNNLGRAMYSAGYSHIKVIAYDHNCDNTAYPIDVCNNSTYVDGAAFHLYDPASNFSAMTVVKNATNKNIYFTEQITESGGSFSGDFGWHMQKIVTGSLNNWAKTVLEWNLANNSSIGPHTLGGCTTCQGAYTISNSTSYTRNVSYYIIGQVSKFVKAGAVRIESSSSNSAEIYTTAFRNPDGSMVVLAYNSGAAKTVKVVNGSLAFSYPIPSASAATFVWSAGTVIPVTGVTVSPTSASILVGATQQLTATVSPSNATNKNVLWSSSNASIASVNSTGLVTGVSAGTAIITVSTVDGNKSAISTITVAALDNTPYTGTPVAIPGIVEMENFDKGGETIAFHDAETTNQGSQYRTSEGVDIEVCTEGGYNVGWTAAGEWLEYTVNVATTGTYTIESRVASTGTTGIFHIEFNGSDKTGAINVPNTTGWQSWQTVTKTDVSLSAGQQIMRIYIDAAGFNINKITITSSFVPVTGVTISPTSASTLVGATQQLTATVSPSNATNKNVLWSSSNASIASVNSTGLVTGVSAGTAIITASTVDGNKSATSNITVAALNNTPYTGTPVAIPGVVEMENFDKGGETIAFHDAETTNQGGQYRTSEGVDIEACTEGGYNIGWTATGEWLEYTVNVATTGTYTIESRVASTGTTGIFHIEFNGSDKTGAINVPNTTGWQTWQTVTKTGISLTAGQQIMRIYIDAAGFNINKITLTNVTPVTGVSVSPTSASLFVGGTQQLTATIIPSNATNKNVLWSSNNASIASVNSTGLVTGVSAGTATITVTTADGNKIATSAITVSTAPSTFPGYYNIFSVNSSKGLDIAENSMVSGGRIQQWEITSGGGYNQRWRLDDAGSGYYYIKVKSTQMCLSPENSETGDGLKIQQKTCDGSNVQKWAVVSVGTDIYRITNVNSGKSLDVEGVSKDNGANIQVWTYGGGLNQQWRLVQVETTKSAKIETSLALTDNSNRIDIYPNPINDYAIIRSANFENYKSVEVYNVFGSLVLSKPIKAEQGEMQLNMMSLKEGIYFIKLKGSLNSSTFKIIKK